MKKIKYFVSLAIMGIIALSFPFSTVLVTSIGLISCDTGYGNEEPPDTQVNRLPILTINPPQSSVFDVSWGEDVNFHIEAKSNTTSKKDLKELRFQVVGGLIDTTWYPKTTEKNLFKIDFVYTVPTSANADDVITIKVTAKDVDSKITTKTFLLTVRDLSGLKTFNDIILGGQSNTTYGSFYASSTNTVYKVADAKVQGQTTVDFIYFYGSQKTAAIAAPAYADFGTGTGELAVFEVDKWTTRRATKFKQSPAMTEDEWKSLTDSKVQQKYATASGSEVDIAPYLADASGGGIPSHYLFKTASSNYGIFRVKFISAYDGTGYIKIDVKVMK